MTIYLELKQLAVTVLPWCVALGLGYYAVVQQQKLVDVTLVQQHILLMELRKSVDVVQDTLADGIAVPQSFRGTRD
jgi:hypothetical protein